MFHERYGVFKLDGFAAASEFCEWVQVGIDEYIPHGKNQAKPHSCLWFLAACAAAILHRNGFFCFYQKDSYRCKRVLEDAKLAYANKTKESVTSHQLGTQEFCRIGNSVLNKRKSSIQRPRGFVFCI